MAGAFKRILLKLSGESIGDSNGRGIDLAGAAAIARQIADLSQTGAQIGVVIGGGNLWRGAGKTEINRTTADTIGMLGTVMNGLAMAALLESLGVQARVQSALSMERVAEPFIRSRAIRHLEKNRIVIFTGGTGNPFFTTDTAAALRANEIQAEVLLKATTVDGVYDKDPRKHPDARLYSTLTYQQVIEQDLRVMDHTAITLCRENNLPLLVFNMDRPNAIIEAVGGKRVGTYIGLTPPPGWE